MLCLLLALACQRSTHLPPDSATADSSHVTNDADASDTSRDTSVDTSDTSVDTSQGDTSDTARDTSDSATDTSTDTGAPADPWTICESYARPTARGRVEDGALDEISGIAVSRQNAGVLWVHEDSGNPNVLTALDTSGRTLATLTLDGATNVDWEDLAIGPCVDTSDPWCIVVGDIGDNGATGRRLALYTIVEPVLDGATDIVASPTRREVEYPDAPEDAEALALLPDGTPVLVSKRSDATAGIYTLEPGASVLTWQSDIATGAAWEGLSAMATAADLTPDGARLLVRSYLHLYEFDVRDLAAPVLRGERSAALEVQGEAVAYDPVDGGFWQVAEGSRATLFKADCAP